MQTLKHINGAIYIYVNNSPCLLCLERYKKILKDLKMRFYIYYTNTYPNDKLPKDKNEINQIRNLDIYKQCESEIQDNIEPKKTGKKKQGKEQSQISPGIVLGCVNKITKRLYKSGIGNIRFKKIDLNSKYIPRLRALLQLLN